MRKLAILLLALVSLVGATQAATPTVTKSKPVLENDYGAAGVTSGRPMKKGHVYVMADRPYLKVVQNTDLGLLIAINMGAFSFQLPDRFLLKSSKMIADDSFLPLPTCGIYNGLTKYQTVAGSTATVHQFTEVGCSGYLKKTSPRKLNTVVAPKPAKPNTGVTREEIDHYALSVVKPYIEDLNQRLTRNWMVPNVELRKSDTPVVVSAIIMSDGQVYNARVEEPSEPKGRVAVVYNNETDGYRAQLDGFFQQNHLILDNSAKIALETLQLPPIPGIMNETTGMVAKFRFDPLSRQAQLMYDRLEHFKGDKSQLVKTSTPPVKIYYSSRPQPPLSPSLQYQQAQLNQQVIRSQQAQAQYQRDQRVNQGISTGVMTLQQLLPLFSR
ncbi:MAG: hypothetical protein VKJ04_09415 [Vampirovibrionales bacterium]|nr:hypothetical protein [Vampirovibrionales bacterium]